MALNSERREPEDIPTFVLPSEIFRYFGKHNIPGTKVKIRAGRGDLAVSHVARENARAYGMEIKAIEERGHITLVLEKVAGPTKAPDGPLEKIRKAVRNWLT